MSGWLPSIFGDHFSKVEEKKEETTKMPALEDFLAANLPARHAQYANAYAAASVKHHILLDPINFALLHAGVIDRESYAGLYLRPPGPGGTGDPSARWIDVDNIPDAVTYVVETQGINLYTGNSKTSDSGKTLIEVSPPSFAGATIPGWGYGLGQIDFVSFFKWLETNDWTDPIVNLDKSAEILANAIESLADVQAGVAAYNAGISRVKRNKSNPDRVTTGGDYSTDVLARAEKFGMTRQT